MADLVGKQFNNYLLLKKIGGGGFADVYLSEHVHRKTQLAVKVLKMQLANDNVKDFLNEARTFRLRHPNIIELLDFGVEGDTPFLVMTYIPNGSLRKNHPKGVPLPLTTIVSYVNQIAKALQYAHDEGIVHRDIKPDNMLLGLHREVLLSDFGIATMSQSLHQSQQYMTGTISYMAPEQIQGHARRASDQYALGIVVYEWLSGTLPFNGSYPEIAAQHLSQNPPPFKKDLQIPLAVENVVRKALAKDPGQRFPSVHEFAVALEKASQPEIPAVISSLVGTTVYIYRGHYGSVSAVAWSPNDNYIASGSRNAVHVWETSTGTNLFAYGSWFFWTTDIKWSPDSMRIASGSGGGTVQIRDLTSRKRIYTYWNHGDFPVRTIVAWSPNGNYIASAINNRKNIHVWEAATGKDIYIYKDHTKPITSVAWSPNGTRIASGSTDSTVRVWDVTTGNNVLTYRDHTRAVTALAWSPDGTHIASGSADNTIRVWDVTTGTLIHTYYGHYAQITSIAWSPDGKRIASVSKHEKGVVQVWDTNHWHNVFAYHGYFGQVRAIAWSPDSTRIASANSDGTVHIWIAP